MAACEKCNLVHVPARHPTGPCCTGHISSGPRKGQPCANAPRHGQTKCGYHGGGAPRAKAAAERRDTEAKASVVMRRFGGPIDTTPSEALLDTVKWTAGYVAWLRDKVAAARMDLSLTQRSTQTGKREPSVWLDLLGTWQDKLVKVCEAAIRAGIEERRVRIAEQQGALVADVIRKILGDLQLTPEQTATAGEAVPRHLRLLAG